MKLLSSLKDRYQGRPAAVLGGGPSLITDLPQLPRQCLLIAVNYHAFYHCEPRWMVYLDDPMSNEHMMRIIRDRRVTKVCPDSEFGGNVRMDVEYWRGNVSSTTATWLALWMGCDPVVLCGMDLYQGPVKYCHPTNIDAPAWHYPLADHLRTWQEECKNSVPHPERIRVMSGPLIGLFQKYEQGFPERIKHE
jgi:hypothetical protein